MNRHAERYFNNIKYNLAQLDEVLENLDKKIKNQSEELKRKDVRIGELKHELWKFNHPKTTTTEPILIEGEIYEYVPVVRCKDCKNYVFPSGGCLLYKTVMVEDDYCSCGERREK